MNRKQMALDLERLLRLRTHPVGVRLCEQAEELAKGKVPSAKVSLCQMVKGAAHGGWTLACPMDQMGCFTGQMILGFREPGEKDIEHHRAQFAKDAEIARALMEIKPKLKGGEIEGVLVGPLDDFEPHLLILLVDAHQALGLIEAFAYSRGEALQFTNGVSSAVCSYGVVHVHRTQKPNLTVPCVGSKRYGLMQDDELIFTLPFSLAAEILESMREMEAAKKFPIPIVSGFLSPTTPINYLLK
ncbi:MAG: DUF169 domain-containing protein [candidate division NC10 bacterium]|nr:DUF169 domain-containing protein [candidate division NC10 bacterium]